MSENYTTEDFAQANLATKGRFGVARRTDQHDTRQWHAYGYGLGWLSDEDMAADGWVPAVEATEVMQNRQIDAEAHLDQIERMSKRLAAAGDQIESQRIVIEDLREENYRLERILQTPLSVKDLEVAWEAAEVPTASTGIRAGDVCIELCADHHFEVFRASVSAGGMVASGRWEPAVRILSRAPREPWADLADSLEAEVQWIDRFNAVDAAQALYAAGWRKGGDES